MTEVKERLKAIEVLRSNQQGIPSPLVREFGYLQLRMICEIIGLSCLVAHGDLVEVSPSKLRKAYKPNEIFDQLSGLHQDFFPFPISPQRTEIGWHMAAPEGRAHLTKADLIELWSRCGDVLHRGSLKNLVSPKSPFQNNFSELSAHEKRIASLLDRHTTLRRDRKYALICYMNDISRGGNVSVIIGVAQESTE